MLPSVHRHGLASTWSTDMDVGNRIILRDLTAKVPTNVEAHRNHTLASHDRGRVELEAMEIAVWATFGNTDRRVFESWIYFCKLCADSVEIV